MIAHDFAHGLVYGVAVGSTVGAMGTLAIMAWLVRPRRRK